MVTQKILNIYKPKLTKKKKVYCSPTHKNNKHTCFSRNSLVKIARAWNKSNKKKEKIPVSQKISIQKIWSHINSRLNKSCDGEWCWVQQSFVKSLTDNEINSTFRPPTPREWYDSKSEWLSTLDIENVMQQYENKYRDFLFIGPVPIDFDQKYSMGSCIADELCKISLTQLIRKKIKNIGIIFNLDKHDQGGSHWIAMYIDLRKKGIYYWDSYGEPPPKEVDVLAKRLQSQAKKRKFKLDYKVNNVRHQYQNSECGVYCMYFITKLLQGKSYEDIINNKIGDKKMNMKRGYFYSPSCK